MMLDIAKRLENVLKKRLVNDIDLLNISYSEKGSPSDRLEQTIGKDLRSMGFRTDFVKQAPLDIFAREKALIVSDIESEVKRLKKRISSLSRFVRLTEKPALVITDRIREDELDGIPIIDRSELKDTDSRSLIKMARKK